MQIRAIRQAVTEDCLFKVLAEWCKRGAGRKNCSLQILSAFASGQGVLAISPLIDSFLADGNEIQCIVGMDRDGTDRDALKRLAAIAEAYPSQAIVHVFQAPAKHSIFHPKLYLYRQGNQLSAIVGSANLTAPGLGSNLESLLLYERSSITSDVAKELKTIWSTFAKPKPPLKVEFLQQLTVDLAKTLGKKLPSGRRSDTAKGRAELKALWKPLSHTPLPRSQNKAEDHTTEKRRGLGSSFLVMDVMGETRKTQMQIPLGVVEEFFGVPRHDEAEIHVSILTSDGHTLPIDRPIVKSGSRKKKRLMRRLEMPQIRELSRPLVVVFVRLRGSKRFAFRLLPRGTRAYRAASKLLDQYGQQGGRERRYYIGKRSDAVWKGISSYLP